MSKENRYLLINTFVLLLLSLVVIFAYSTYMPLEPKDKLFNQVVTLDDAVVLHDIPTIGHYEVIHSIQNVFNLKGDKIGVVYHVYARNGYTETPQDDFGYIELLVGINLENEVYVEIVKLSQTSIYNVAIQDYINDYYQGFSFSELIGIPVVNVEDLEAGVTASRSTGSIKNLVAMAIDEYVNHSSSLSEVTVG